MAAPASLRFTLTLPPPSRGEERYRSAVADLRNVLKEAAGRGMVWRRKNARPKMVVCGGTATKGRQAPGALPLPGGGACSVAGHTVLAGINLTIDPGSHVRLLGPQRLGSRAWSGRSSGGIGRQRGDPG
jgi:hypothetical protein